MSVIDATGTSSAWVHETTTTQLSEKCGDTVHININDRWGNMVSATPLGGWLQSSPIVPGLGFCLNSRTWMFWPKDGMPTSLAPGKRPRSTLPPSIAFHEGGAAMAFGAPGGDQQDQRQLSLFLRIMHHGLNLQVAIDLPLFHATHFPGFFHPRRRQPGHVLVADSLGADALAALRAKGHAIDLAPERSVGRHRQFPGKSDCTEVDRKIAAIDAERIAAGRPPATFATPL